jgi:prevent-host-death family protein
MLIPTKDNFKTITEVREDTLGVLRDASSQGLVYVTHHSKPKAVLIDIDQFVRMQEMLEDYQDLQDARKLSRQKRGKLIPASEVFKHE